MFKMPNNKLVLYTTLAINAMMLIISIALLIVSAVSNRHMSLNRDAS